MNVTFGMTRIRIRVVVASGSFFALASMVALVSALVALYPLGAGGGGGVGLLGGVYAGFTVAIVLMGPVAVVLAILTAGAEEESGLARDLRICGVHPRVRYVSAALASSACALVVVVAGVLGGASSALGDGLRRSATSMGSAPISFRGVAMGVGWFLFALLLALAAAATTRSATKTALALPVGFALFLLGLRMISPESPARSVLALSPFGPVWSWLLPPSREAIVLSMGEGLRLVVVAFWSVLSVLAVSWRCRQPG